MSDEPMHDPILGLFHDFADEMDKIVAEAYRQRRAVTLPDQLDKEALQQAELNHRSYFEQVEHWLRIGKLAEENPDSTYAFIKSVLLAEL